MTQCTSGFALVLLAAFTLGLIGCGSSDSTLTSAPSSTDGSVASKSTAGDSQDSAAIEDTSQPDSDFTSDENASSTPDTVAQEQGSDDALDDESLEVAADESDGPDTEYFMGRIQSALQNGDLPKAIEVAEQTYQSQPEDSQVLTVLVQLLMQQAQSETDPELASAGTDRAMKIAEQAHQAKPDDNQVSSMLLQLLMLEARTETDPQVVSAGLGKAEKLLEGLASQFDPKQLEGIQTFLSVMRAMNHVALDEIDEAIVLLKQARESGFPVENILSDPQFQVLAENEEVLTTLRGWILEATREEIASGESFPFEFSLTTYDDAQTVSLEDQKGKVVIVDFWGTWCGPCKMEIPHFIKLQDKYPDELAIVGINYEDGTAEQVKQQIAKFVQDMGINYPCVIGDDETRARVPDFEGYPTTLFIDRTGKVRLKVVGLNPYEKLEAIVDVLLAEGKS